VWRFLPSSSGRNFGAGAGAPDRTLGAASDVDSRCGCRTVRHLHGYAHGKELPHAAQPLAFGMAFVLATGMLHVIGISLGTLHQWPSGARVLRLLGAGVACVSVFLVATAFGMMS